MHVDNFEEVSNLLTIIKQLNKAYSQTFKFIDGRDESGYSMNISKHSDGSGNRVDLTGCMVAKEVIKAVQREIENKFESVVAELESFGVDCSGLVLDEA